MGEIKGWFKEILLIGKELGLVKVGTIYIDGTKIQANASRHKAMSYAYMQRMEEQLEGEISRLLDLGAAQDEKEKDQQPDLPEELRRRKDRHEKILEAKKVIEQRAAERYRQEQKEFESQQQKRAEQEQRTGKRARGRKTKAPENKPDGADQYNFTDPQSRIMKTPNGFDQCYNAQAVVNEDMLIVSAYSNTHSNDRAEFIPAIASVPQELGKISQAIADTGYFSENNVVNAQLLGLDPLIATSGQKHNSYLERILNREEPVISDTDSVIVKMRKRPKSLQGKLDYSKRKHTVEPVFGIIKEVLDFRRFNAGGSTN